MAKTAHLDGTPLMTAGRDKAGARRSATALLHDIFDDLERGAPGGAATMTPAAAPSRAGDGADPGPTAQLGDVLERLDERAFGFILLLLALPCCLPFVYVLPQIVSVPMIALAAQLAAGRHSPWLPGGLRRRAIPIRNFRDVIHRSEKYVGWVERFARPRLAAVTGHAGARVVGALMLAPAASIMTPLPGTNTVPGIGVALIALGLIERDGILVILGLLIGLAWIALLLTLGLEAATLIKDWLATRV